MQYRSQLSSLVVLLLGVVVIGQGAGAPRRTQNVILITFDGLRWQEVFYGADEALMNKENGGVEDAGALKKAFWRDTPEARRAALLPFFWGVIAQQGQVFGNVNKGSAVKVTNGKNFSYPGYNEILAGFPDDRIDSNAKRPNPNVTVLEWLNQRSPYRHRVAAFCSWDVFPFIINRERSGVFVNAAHEPVQDGKLTERQELLNRLMSEITPPWEGVRWDALTFYSALEYLKKHKPRVLYIAFDETDDYAHAGRYDRYLESAHRTDAFIKTLWETLQAMPEYRGTTSLVLTTDHGRGGAPTEWKGHGANVKGAENIWIAVLGPDTPALGERTNVATVTQSQVAATVAALLGEDYCAAVPQAGKPIAGIWR
ncbi:MAG: sulfatase-like hydrolase/transferase [Abditibacteriales bacterium]|nr:sulfatase-like hydrolase/transferase [Abditibacteriales bacterium]MDW8365235.1 sulfatase-like hydrolase/transferase [Abditibacteriales bacterium]